MGRKHISEETLYQILFGFDLDSFDFSINGLNSGVK
jgi:hypothetical protein